MTGGRQGIGFDPQRLFGMMGSVVSIGDLLERDDQRARLEAAVDEARSGSGRLVLVTGEAGVGKTALVESVAARCGTDVRVWTGSCEQLFTARPLGPLADIASKSGGQLAEVLGRGAPVHEVFAVLLEELRSQATVVVIEDVHWADEATLDVIVLLARRLATTCSTMIVTSRDELSLDHPMRLVLGRLAASGVERLRLSPLSLDGVCELAEPHGFDADELFYRTSGNPFFVTEVLATGCTELPPSVRDAVLARAAGLDPDARTLLESVAIVTGSVPLALVTALGGAHAGRLDACLSSGMLVESNDGIAFRHDLAREALAEGIEPLRRAALHVVALEVLREDGADPARLAHHADAAGDVDAVTEFAPLAAAEAAGQGSHREAAAQYRRAFRFCAASVAYAGHNGGDNLKDVRKATKQFRSLAVANNSGYEHLVDKDGIACIDMPGMGAMGVHNVNGALVGDGAVDELTPEAVVYEPDERGRPHLVALEYVVFKDAWDADHGSKPSLFGQSFDTTPDGNRFGLPAFYSLHVWLYRHNPAGMFAMWNPDVTCTPDDGHGGHDGHDGHGGSDHVDQLDG